MHTCLPIPSHWLSDFDKHLVSEGTHERSYEKLGAHFLTVDGQKGVAFAVWAPNAKGISIIGDFNGWQDHTHKMTPTNSGIWTLFITDLQEFSIYKFRIFTQDNQFFDKSDPYGFCMEERPKTGSLVIDLNKYQWSDQEWILNRAARQSLDGPISIYEVHLGSWRKIPDERWGYRYQSYRELAESLIPYVLELGYTHIELLPIAEYPFDGSWGYQVLGFFCPNQPIWQP